MKKTKLLCIFIIMAILILFSACTRNPGEISMEDAVVIAQKHFQDKYEKSVVVEKVSYEMFSQTYIFHHISQDHYRNKIFVLDGETEYTLVLDKRNKPAFDNFSAIETIKSIDISSFDDRIRQLGLKRHEYYDLEVVASFQDLKYSVYFSVVSEDSPRKDSKDGIYSLLEELKNEGVDGFIINIDSPSFLLPKIEFGYGVHGLRLTGIGFKTDIDLASFEEQYYNFVDQVYWDKQKFDEKMQELTQLGYKNACFFIPRWDDGNTLEIVLYCESDNSLSDEPAIALLKEMDDSYFRVGDNEIKYTLQHIYK